MNFEVCTHHLSVILLILGITTDNAQKYGAIHGKFFDCDEYLTGFRCEWCNEHPLHLIASISLDSGDT